MESSRGRPQRAPALILVALGLVLGLWVLSARASRPEAVAPEGAPPQPAEGGVGRAAPLDPRTGDAFEPPGPLTNRSDSPEPRWRIVAAEDRSPLAGAQVMWFDDGNGVLGRTTSDGAGWTAPPAESDRSAFGFAAHADGRRIAADFLDQTGELALPLEETFAVDVWGAEDLLPEMELFLRVGPQPWRREIDWALALHRGLGSTERRVQGRRVTFPIQVATKHRLTMVGRHRILGQEYPLGSGVFATEARYAAFDLRSHACPENHVHVTLEVSLPPGAGERVWITLRQEEGRVEIRGAPQSSEVVNDRTSQRFRCVPVGRYQVEIQGELGTGVVGSVLLDRSGTIPFQVELDPDTGVEILADDRFQVRAEGRGELMLYERGPGRWLAELPPGTHELRASYRMSGVTTGRARTTVTVAAGQRVSWSPQLMLEQSVKLRCPSSQADLQLTVTEQSSGVSRTRTVAKKYIGGGRVNGISLPHGPLTLDWRQGDHHGTKQVVVTAETRAIDLRR